MQNSVRLRCSHVRSEIPRFWEILQPVLERRLHDGKCFCPCVSCSVSGPYTASTWRVVGTQLIPVDRMTVLPSEPSPPLPVSSCTLAGAHVLKCGQSPIKWHTDRGQKGSTLSSHLAWPLINTMTLSKTPAVSTPLFSPRSLDEGAEKHTKLVPAPSPLRVPFLLPKILFPQYTLSAAPSLCSGLC